MPLTIPRLRGVTLSIVYVDLAPITTVPFPHMPKHGSTQECALQTMILHIHTVACTSSERGTWEMDYRWCIF